MIVEGGRKYNVRLIPQTCNREDAVREIVGALDHLSTISDEIFSTIRIRLNSHRKKVEALSSRVATASEQVSALKGSQKAIRIVSPAKYPCENNELLYGSSGGNAFGSGTFPALVAKHVPDQPTLGLNVEEDEEIRCQRPFRFDTPIKHPNDLLSVFHVKEPKLGDLNQLDNVADVGLGRAPPTISNMDSFFLFNTVDNPYINYKMTERSLQDRNFGTLKPTRKAEEAMGETCPTVSHENGAERKTDIDDFYYSPSASEIPNIDVPESLPDLPGIAESFDLPDDLLGFPPYFSSIATPTVSSVPTQPSHQSTPSSLGFLPEISDDFFAVHTSTPATDKPPGPPSLETTKDPNITTNVPSTVALAPPPPPPPPPPVLDTIAPTKNQSNSISMNSSNADGGDLRSSLMAAIREAGGSGKASLKSAQDRKYEAKKKKQDEKEKTITSDLQEGGDLMADLKNTLAMRRRGISGIQDGQKRAPGGVGDIMLSLASAIPTIDNSMESSSGPNGGSDEDDWD